MPAKKRVRSSRPRRKPAKASPSPVPSTLSPTLVQPLRPPFRLPWILLGWVLTAVFFSGIQHFNPVYNTSIGGFSDAQWRALIAFFVAGTLLLWWGLKAAPEADPSDDIGRVPARILLFLILGLAAFLRLYDLSAVPANFWDDPSQTLFDAVQMSDYGHLIRYGYAESGEPGYAYLLAPVLYFFPRVPGILAQRFLGTGLDLATIWLFYLLGKEFGKRRIGLLMASFGAVNKPLLIFLLSYMRYPTLTATMALLMLQSLRLFKNPSLKHFLYFSVSLSLCYYTYTAFRPLGPYFLLAVLVWVFWREREAASKAWDWALGLGLVGWMVFLFLYLHRFFFKEDNPFRHLLEWLVEKAHLPYAWAAGLVWVGWKVWREARLDGTKREVLRWTWCALLFAALITPALLPIELRTRIQNLNSLGIGANSNLLQAAGAVWHRVSLTLNTLYYTGGDRSDLSLYGDPFFDVSTLVFILPGLVYVALRPRAVNLFILGMAVLGLVPHILADPGSNRLIDCLEPLLLLGALGVNLVMEGAACAPWRWFWKTLVLLIWAGGVAFAADANFQKVYLHFEKMPGTGPGLARQAVLDNHAPNRVYLACYDLWPAQTVMNETNTTYWFSTDSNVLYLAPSEAAPDVVVLFQSNMPPKPGSLEKVIAQFPKAQVTRIPMKPWLGGDDPSIVRVLIPGTQLDGNKSKLFHIERVPAANWTRQFYKSGYRMGYGLIMGEDRVAGLRDPFLPGVPTSILGECTARLEGSWEAPAEGKYEFSVETGQGMDLWVGDKLVLRARPGSKRTYKASAHFEKGIYPVRIMALNPVGSGVPLVTVRETHSTDWRPL